MYHLRLLGSISLEGPLGLVSGRTTQRRRLALLALLGSAGDAGFSRDKLIGLLWPDNTYDQARHLLSDSVYVVRQELGEDSVLASGDVLRLNADVVWTDLVAFEVALKAGDLKKAVELYRAPFLDGFHVTDAPELERWIDGERARVAGSCASALETLAQQAEDASDHSTAVERWRVLAAQERHDSRIALRLMQALVAAGNPVGALEHARVHEMLVRDELESEPSTELLEYAERIKEQSWSASGAVAPGRARAAPTTTNHEQTGPRGRRLLRR